MIRLLAIIIPIYLITFNLCAQTTDFVKSDSIIYPIHKANVGKIAFMGKAVPIENFKQSDFVEIDSTATLIINKDGLMINANSSDTTKSKFRGLRINEKGIIIKR